MIKNIIKKIYKLVIISMFTVIMGIVFIIWITGGFKVKLITVNYDLYSDKITNPVKIALITDFHSCNYGLNQEELTSQLDRANPDLVLLGGDIIDDGLPRDNAIELLSIISEKYTCYYVTGNHEFYTGEIEEIKELVESFGISVLDGKSDTIDVNGEKISICGVDDSRCGSKLFYTQLERSVSMVNLHDYTILLAHRPEYIKTYLEYPFDLVLSGHTHGGQWRIPKVLNGFIAPHQGFFPEYAGGKYEFENADFIVSRGLSRESTRVIPRIYNPNELVIISLKSEKDIHHNDQ